MSGSADPMQSIAEGLIAEIERLGEMNTQLSELLQGYDEEVARALAARDSGERPESEIAHELELLEADRAKVRADKDQFDARLAELQESLAAVMHQVASGDGE